MPTENTRIPVTENESQLSPIAPGIAEVDKLTLNALKTVHNYGAGFYNKGDSLSCYRIYETLLRVIKDYLPHHPSIQSIIDDGLAEVEMTEGSLIQAFHLHEVIETVRQELKTRSRKSSVIPPPPKPNASTQNPGLFHEDQAGD